MYVGWRLESPYYTAFNLCLNPVHSKQIRPALAKIVCLFIVENLQLLLGHDGVYVICRLAKVNNGRDLWDL